MYYTMSKKQYRKYEKEFRKTYVGRQYYVYYLASYIFTLLFFLGINVWMMLDSNTTIDWSRLTCVLVMISFLIGGTIIWVHYMRELKEFIMAKEKK